MVYQKPIHIKPNVSNHTTFWKFSLRDDIMLCRNYPKPGRKWEAVL